jgi:hypothetical protein
LTAFVLGETEEKLAMKSADAFSVRWKVLGRAHTKGGSSGVSLPPLMKAADFADSEATQAVFPEIVAPVASGRYELLLEVEDKLSQPPVRLSEVIASEVTVVAGPPAKIKMHGGPKNDQQFDATRCLLLPAVTISVGKLDFRARFGIPFPACTRPLKAACSDAFAVRSKSNDGSRLASLPDINIFPIATGEPNLHPFGCCALQRIDTLFSLSSRDNEAKELRKAGSILIQRNIFDGCVVGRLGIKFLTN